MPASPSRIVAARSIAVKTHVNVGTIGHIGGRKGAERGSG
jgi:hypothetical protein